MTDVRVDAQRKAELLSKEVRHIDIKSFDARPIILTVTPYFVAPRAGASLF